MRMQLQAGRIVGSDGGVLTACSAAWLARRASCRGRWQPVRRPAHPRCTRRRRPSARAWTWCRSPRSSATRRAVRSGTCRVTTSRSSSAGRPRRIVDFKASDQGPVSLAILFDVSGSMRIGIADAGRTARRRAHSELGRAARRRVRAVLLRPGSAAGDAVHQRPRRRSRGAEAADGDRPDVALRRHRDDGEDARRSSLAPARGRRHHRRHRHEQRDVAVRRVGHRERRSTCRCT